MTRWHWFDEVAEDYRRFRPTYPAAVFDALGDLRGLDVLEVGPGTGQATVELVRRGARVTAYEAGATLARLTAEAAPGACVVHAPVEEADGTWDLVCGFSSLHWLGDGLWPLAHRLARPGGRLAVVGAAFLAGELERRTRPVHERYVPGDAGPWARLDQIGAPWTPPSHFAVDAHLLAPRSAPITGTAYACLARTWSVTGTLDPADRAAYLRDLTAAAGDDAQLEMCFVLDLYTRKESP